MNNFEALVALNLIPQVGSAKLERLLEYFGEPHKIFQSRPASLLALVGEELAERIRCFDSRELADDLRRAKESGVKITVFTDLDYPASLRQIPGYPIVLYYTGTLTATDSQAVGIVGSRRASFYGLNQAEKFAASLAQYGLTVVSGLARGVDTYAHRGALKAGGRTLAVIGSGFEHLYPAENIPLAEEIAACGAVISEFPMRTMPLAFNFPRRNRLISGLSLGVLITEAARNSGALITADFALEQSKEVFVLPGRIDAPYAWGSNALLKQGAKLVTACDDILDELGLVLIKRQPQAASPGYCQGKLEGAENCLYQYLNDQPVAVDELVEKTSLGVQQVLDLTLRLQLKKLIKALPGKQFIRSSH